MTKKHWSTNLFWEPDSRPSRSCCGKPGYMYPGLEYARTLHEVTCERCISSHTFQAQWFAMMGSSERRDHPILVDAVVHDTSSGQISITHAYDDSYGAHVLVHKSDLDKLEAIEQILLEDGYAILPSWVAYGSELRDGSGRCKIRVHRVIPVPIDTVIDLGKFALGFGRVNRATFHEDGKTLESDTDHTVMLGWIVCAVAYELKHQKRLSIDVGRVAEMAFIHDMVEGVEGVGDTNTFDISEEARAAKKRLEEEALQELLLRFEHAPWIVEAVIVYEDQVQFEARLVRYVDKMMPKITHYLNGCATMKAMGKTLADLRRSHDAQVQSLRAEYPDIASYVEPMLLQLMTRAEGAFDKTASSKERA